IAEARAGLSSPSWEAGHMASLIGEKLAALDAGFGIDAMVLAAVQVERPPGRQGALSARLAGSVRGEATELTDRLANRLGSERVIRIVPRASHIPERAVCRIRALAGEGELSWPLPSGPQRPALLLDHPEPIRVLAEVPEGAPARFTWRRVEHRIV